MDEFKNLLEIVNKGIPEYESRLNTMKEINKSHGLIVENLYKKLGIDLNKDVEMIFNTNNLKILITISTLDLLVNTKGLITSKNEWEKVFHIKNTFLIIYETINTCNQINKIYKEYNELIFDEIKEIRSILKPFSRNGRIGFIRNKTIGHIHLEKNFEIYFDTIDSFNLSESLSLINDFINGLNKIDRTIDNIMLKIKEFQNDQKELTISKNKKLIDTIKKINSSIKDKEIISQLNNLIEILEKTTNTQLF